MKITIHHVEPTPLDLTGLADQDSHEELQGVAWVVFRGRSLDQGEGAIGLRIEEGAAAPFGGTSPRLATQVVPFGQAWARALAFIEVNGLRLEDRR